MIGHSRGHGSAAHPLSHSEAEALISARLDAPLTPQQEQRLASHLATCASCRQFADQMYAMSAGIRSLPRLPASPIVSRQVRERIAQPQSIWERIGGLMGGRVGFAPMAATAAMLALVIAGYALFQGNDDNGRLGPTITAGTVVAQNATQTSDASQVTQTSSSEITPGVEMPTETPVNVPNVRASDETPTETPTTAVLAAEAPTSTATETDTPTTVPTETSVPTDTPTETSVPTDTPEPTATRTPKPEPTETPAPTETTVPTEVPTATETATTEPTATKTPTAEPTATNTATAEPTATRTPTKEPTATRTPTEEPTATETREPTETATPEPTETPKPKRPTRTPTAEPTATEEPAQQPTIGPSDNTAPTEAPPPPTEVPTETPVEEPTDSTQIVPVDGTGAAGETPISEATAETTAIGGPTEEPNGDQTSNTAALLDDTARIAGISSGGAPLGPLRVNSPGSLMVLSSDAGGSDLQVVSMSDGSVVAHLGAGADPIWSPLGIVLLYQSYADGTPSVGLYDGDTGKFEPISDPSKDGAVQDIPAGWSGTSAYYLRETGDQDSTVILYGYDVNSGETTEVWRSTGVALSGGRPIPTGDGFLIATTASWLLVGADGSESNLGPNDFGLTGEGFLSPGANLVAYPAGDQLIVADASSPGIPMAQIPYVNGNGAGFTWSPDGSYLAVSDGYSLQIYDTSGNFLAAATSDNGVTIAAPQWLSDGIYYVETSPTPSLRRLLESKIPGI